MRKPKPKEPVAGGKGDDSNQDLNQELMRVVDSWQAGDSDAPPPPESVDADEAADDDDGDDDDAEPIALTRTDVREAMKAPKLPAIAGAKSRPPAPPDDEPKAEEPKAEEPKAEEPKAEEPEDDSDAPMSDEPPSLRTLSKHMSMPAGGERENGDAPKGIEDVLDEGDASHLAYDALMASLHPAEPTSRRKGPPRRRRRPKPKSERESKSNKKKKDKKKKERQSSAPVSTPPPLSVEAESQYDSYADELYSERPASRRAPAAAAGSERIAVWSIVLSFLLGIAATLAVQYAVDEGSRDDTPVAAARPKAPTTPAAAATAEQPATADSAEAEQPTAEVNAEGGNLDESLSTGTGYAAPTTWPSGTNVPSWLTPPATATATEEPTAAPEASATATAEPAAAPAPFDKLAASAALGGAAGAAAACGDGITKGSARVAVIFAPSGRATTALIEGGPLQGTPVGGCIARTMRSARVPAFTGGPVTVRKTVHIR